MIEWLRFLYEVCTSSESPANWREIAIAANLATAVAYFWIPGVMAVVFTRWREELPYRWLWVGFVVFITACGLSHIVHAFHAVIDDSPHSNAELIVLAATALVSLVTAAGFTYLLPTILRLSSPAEARRKLEAAVEGATANLQLALEHERLLLLEVHHRVKNNLQVTASLISLHLKNAPGLREELTTLRDRISAMAAVHGQLQDVGSTALKAKPFITALAHMLKQAKGDEEIAVEVEGDDFEVQLDHAASFALIIHEVLASTLRQLGRVQGPCTLTATLARTGALKAVSLTCRAAAVPGPSQGVGKTLVTALARQLGATISWQAAMEGGVLFQMTFEDDGANPTRVF